MKKIILDIEGMTCSACSNGLEKYLNKQKGIKQATVNLVMNTASIEYDDKILKLEDLNKFVAKAGFKSLGVSNLEREYKESSRQKIVLIAISIITFISFVLGMSNMLRLPFIIDSRLHPIDYAIVMAILAAMVMILGFKILKNGIKNLIHLIPNMDTLVAIGVIASFLYSMYGLYNIYNGEYHYVHDLYFESCTMVIFFVKIGKYIENKNKNKTKEAIQKLVTITPKNATIERDGKEVVVTIDEIKKGDIVITKSGEKFSVDGTVIDGLSHVDESFITGESIPVKKQKGDIVVAGSINNEGLIKYKAEKIGKESTVSEIVKMVVDATNTKPPIAKYVDIISGFFVRGVIGIALLSFGIKGLFFDDFSGAINALVSVLVVACPCSLGLATPLAIVIAEGLASQNGILVKSSTALEWSGYVKTVVFDKTGTLTKGILTVSKVINYSDKIDESIIGIIASLEKNSSHPIAKGIVNYAVENKVLINKVDDFKTISGYGIQGNIDDITYYVGNRQLMEQNKIKIKNTKDEDELTKKGNSILYLGSSKGELLALVGIKDVKRIEAQKTIEELTNQNIDTVMLTGDNNNVSKIIADEVGIKKVIANATPKKKAEEIEKLRKNGLVMMIGDGINDSVSLVKSDIGVAIGNGTDIAIDSAQVILMNNDISKIMSLIVLSKKTFKNIRQNLFWAFIYNALMIPIAIGLFSTWGITINPMIASFCMMLSSLTVVLNALRLKKIKI